MEEERLVAALRNAEPEAVQELLARYGDRLLRSAFLLCGNEAEAQDLVQDTFLEALRAGPRFRGRSTLYTWLHGILLNLTRHYHRDRKRLVYDDELVGREASEPQDNLAGLDVATGSASLTSALRQLSQPHREVLILRFYENMKVHEVAAHLGVSQGTVKSRLHYALSQMQKLLPAELNLFGAGGTKETAQR